VKNQESQTLVQNSLTVS